MLEFVIRADARFHHFGQRRIFGVFRGDLEVAADVVGDQFLDVFGVAHCEVIAQVGADQHSEENGYWYKIEAWMVEPSEHVPHGIRYNLTLHNNYKRIMGFDNAHAVKSPKRAKFKGRIVTYDHLHQTPVDKGTPYAFSSAEQLLQDFLQRVNQILNEVSKP